MQGGLEGTMRIWVFAALGGVVACSSAFAKETASAPKAEPVVCEKLHADYEDASKRMALNHAEGIGDNSALRATQREAQKASILAEARLMLDLLKGNGCHLPTSAPSLYRYYLSALTCHNDILAAKLSGTYIFPESCRRRSWVPEEPKAAN